jgi:hypothetical protein
LAKELKEEFPKIYDITASGSAAWKYSNNSL